MLNIVLLTGIKVCYKLDYFIRVYIRYKYNECSIRVYKLLNVLTSIKIYQFPVYKYLAKHFLLLLALCCYLLCLKLCWHNRYT